MNSSTVAELAAAQIIGTLRSEDRQTWHFAPDTRLGTPGLELTRGECIQLVLELEDHWNVHLPDEHTDRLESSTIAEITTLFATLLRDRSSSEPPPLPTREDILLLVATARGVEPDEVSEEIDSFTRMWLLHSMEQRHHVPMDTIPSSRLAEMTSVDRAVEVFKEVLHQNDSHESFDREPTP
jgi:hypothetical protein